MILWRRSAMTRAAGSISAIFAFTSSSPFDLLELRRALSSRTRSFIAARSSSVNPPVDFCVLRLPGFPSAMMPQFYRRGLSFELGPWAVGHDRVQSTLGFLGALHLPLTRWIGLVANPAPSPIDY